MSMFERYLSDEFDVPMDMAFDELKDALAVKQRGSGKVLYYIYGDYVVQAVTDYLSVSGNKPDELRKEYLDWLMSNKKKFVVIDDVYFTYSKADFKKIKKEIINKPNKVFING